MISGTPPEQTPAPMCHSCDMDLPVQDDTGGEDLDFIGICRHRIRRLFFANRRMRKPHKC